MYESATLSLMGGTVSCMILKVPSQQVCTERLCSAAVKKAFAS